MCVALAWPREHTRMQLCVPLSTLTLPLQMICHLLGGVVEPADGGGEYGRMPMNIEPDSRCVCQFAQ